MATDRFKEADLQFAIPKVPQSANKNQVVRVGPKSLSTKNETRKVVPEEKYIENITTIIQRDYFPDVKKLKVQKEYLDAIVAGDETKIRELQLKYGIKKAPNATPALSDFGTPSTSYTEAFSTPMTNDGFNYINPEGDNDRIDPPKKKRVKALDKFTLQSYLDNFTSEDNASFEELAALMNERERKKNSWMYDAERRHNEDYRNQLKPITAAADEQLLAIKNTEDKPIAIDGWSYKARNDLIFMPVDEAPLTKNELIERIQMNEVVINKEATRLKRDDTMSAKPVTMARAALHQAANHIGRVDVTGKQLGFVDAETLGAIATPVPEPGVDDTPLMTWGEIDGTPFRLDGDDDPMLADAPVFKIPELPIRDRIANSMNDTIGKRYTNKRKTALNAAAKAHEKTPKFGSKRSQLAMGLSPAAKNLLHHRLGIKVGNSSNNSKVGTPSTRSGSSSVRSTTSSFTATPDLRSFVRTSKQQRMMKSYNSTPDINRGAAAAAVSNLLDLELPSKIASSSNIRPRAVDFD
uniref:Uncharacterized protein n=1 Tax=Panagrolaimus sp. PS1159 TaxID=55785 RepID=A0AC35G868_9BILA